MPGQSTLDIFFGCLQSRRTFPAFLSHPRTGNKGNTDLHFKRSTEICKPKFSQELKVQDQGKRKERWIARNQRIMSCACELAHFCTSQKQAIPDRRQSHLYLVRLFAAPEQSRGCAGLGVGVGGEMASWPQMLPAEDLQDQLLVLS